MSAFLVQDGTMDRVLWAIIKQGGTFAGLDVNLAADRDEIGEKRYAMNHSALAQRYPNYDDMRRATAEVGTYKYVDPFGKTGARESWSAAEACHCLQYQCSEGDIQDTPLYDELVAVTDWADDAAPPGFDKFLAWDTA